MYLKHVITAGILSAALAMGPGAAYAQSTGSTSGTSGTSGSQGTTTGSSTSAAASSHQAGSSGADQEAVRQHLSGAREALAELTKLPAASQLQGDQRQKVAQFISDFNSFATATTDWRTKYDAVDKSLDQLLGLDGSKSMSAAAPAAGASGTGSASTSGTSASASGTTTASGAVGTAGSGDAGALDPTIVAKLREVRTHLDAFEEASGDPSFVVEKIEKILDQASSGGSASGAVGTSGSTDTAASAASGGVTLTAAQVQEIRRQLDSIKAAAKR